LGKPTDIERLRFACLLHDIGKFWQGAGEKGRHPELSARFARQFFPEMDITFVADHHNPSQYRYKGEGYKLLKILVISDWLSSGEREESTETSGGRKLTPLLSIFSEVRILGREKAEERYFLPSVYDPLEAKDPVKLNEITDLTPYYKNLWKRFVQDIEKIRKDDMNKMFESLMSLIKKYCLFVPSAVYKSKPDISLYDHLKTTCAIADCLFKENDSEYIDKLIEILTMEEYTEEDEELLKNDKFILIGGDISGIQKFIYTVISKGAVKGLKGRSYYLELLSEIVARHIVEELGLSIANVIYCAGGHFFILAPLNARDKIVKIREDIVKKLFAMYGGKLYLSIDFVGLSPFDFLLKDGKTGLAEKWGDLSNKLSMRKKKKFEEIVNYEDFFQPVNVVNICRSCGSPLESESEMIIEEGEEEIVKCDLCKGFEEFAKISTGKKYLIVKDGDGTSVGWKKMFSYLGYDISFSDIQSKDDGAKVIYSINKSEIGGKSGATSFFYHLETGLKDLDSLANMSEGIKRWGILRGDVDNLGRIFREGLAKPTLSRISNLSNLMVFFFSGKMNKICESYKEFIYGVYSGGDDFFIIGSWNILPELAMEIRRSFIDFTGNNPSITLSSAISIAPSVAYPVYRLAEIVGEELENKAKKGGKNSIVFLGKVMGWEKFHEAWKLKEKIEREIEKGLSKGFLHKMLVIHSLYNNRMKKNKLPPSIAKYDNRCGRWRWILTYTIARERHIKKEEKDIWRRLISDNIDVLDVVVRWVELLKREEVSSGG